MAPFVVGTADRPTHHPKADNARLPGRVRMTLQSALVILTPVIIFAVPAVALALSIHQLKGGWDDGAITAAFSRTFAAVGRFALTPASAEVEGFSSLSWVLLLALPHYFFSNPEAILIWMKLLSAAAFLLSLLVFRRIALRLLATTEQADMATIFAAFIVPPMLETLNGMEMNLYMLLVLCLVHVLTDDKPGRHRTLWVWALTSALIATRFESPFLIVFLIIGLLFSGDKRSVVQVVVSAGTAFLVIELWRLFEFRSWMPNTFYAKMLPPYSPPQLLLPMLRMRVAATLEIIEILGGALFIVLLVAAGSLLLKRISTFPRWVATYRAPLSVLFFGALFVLTRKVLPILVQYFFHRGHEDLILAVSTLLALAIAVNTCARRQASSLERSVGVLTAAGVAFGILFGKNWGYEGRMILASVPFLVLSIALFLERHIPSQHWRRTALVSCILLQMLVWGGALRIAWAQGDPVPISTIEKTGLAADAVRRLAQLDSLSFLVPDVGGSSLCCERLEILDSGLLTNSYLAHHGYGAFDEYLHHRRPQVIESHGWWSLASQLYRSEVMKDYSLAVVGQSRLLLRNDIYLQLYRQLEAGTGAHVISGLQCLDNMNQNYLWDLDIDFMRSRQNCLYVSRDDLIRNGIPLNRLPAD
jgi:hypothetical protein